MHLMLVPVHSHQGIDMGDDVLSGIGQLESGKAELEVEGYRYLSSYR